MGVQQETLLTKYITIFIVIISYWAVSIFTVFVNKGLLSDIELDAPMFIACYQTLVTALICYIKQILSKQYPGNISFPETNVWDWHMLKSVLPVSFMFTMMIAANNLCLQNVSLAFYYVGRSLTTMFNVIFTYLVLKEKTSLRCLACCAVIIFGFFLGVDQEKLTGSLSVSGTFFGVLASLALSLFSILTKKVLPKLNSDIWVMSYYNNIYATILFLPLIVLNGELNTILSFDGLWRLSFWFPMTIGGICGFSVGFLTSLQIKHTSALTHNISGTAKACTQTVLATYWYQEAKSMLWWTSNIIVLVASATYARIKQLDMEARQALPQYQKV